MVDILRVDTPTTGYDSSRVKPQTNPQQDQLYNVADPARVPKAQDQNVNTDRNSNQGGSLNLDSNFDKFMQAVKDLAQLTDTYGEMFFSRLGSQINAGLDAGFTEALTKYMNLMQMSEEELLALFQNQKDGAVKFSGPFFDLLRTLSQSSSSNELKGAIVDFLRRYDSLSANNHILTNIISNLKSIAGGIPYSRGSELNSLIAKLAVRHPNGENEANLAILKEEIVPFLAKYVEGSKDFGLARDMMGVLTLNIARYELGAKDAFTQSFLSLMGFSEMNRSLPGVDMAALLERMMQAEDKEQPLLSQFLNVLKEGMNGSAGLESREIFRNMLSSMLLNESVYLPLIHMTIPAEIDGRQFFSEVWVDPDDQNGKSGGGGKATKMLIKFDIKNLGFFEMILYTQDGKLDMELFYPEKLAEKEKDIARDISEIVARNNLDFRTLALGKCTVPKSISEVFPKVYERRNAINVTI